MKLFYSPFHTFIHKVLVTAHEAGLWDQIEFVPTYPFKNRDGEDQVTVGHPQQMPVHSAGLVEKVDRRPGTAVVFRDRNTGAFDLIRVRPLDAAGRYSGPQGCDEPAVLSAYDRPFADSSRPGLAAE